MASWGDFSRSAPELAREGQGRLYRSGGGAALLATVRDGAPPRIHPISVAIVGDRLMAFLILTSPKTIDLIEDGRYALHAHMNLARPLEFCVRGRARAIEDPAARAEVAAGWTFSPDETFGLFEFGIEHAILGDRDTADDWPPRHRFWRAAT